MIDGTRRWLRRNRTTLTIGIGVIGVGYAAAQYIVSKVAEARARMSDERVAKENLRRRFQQNQEDCTITVLELLPTVAENILEALSAEKIAEAIQQKKLQRSGKSPLTSDVAPSDLSSEPPNTVEEDNKSLSSFKSENYVHTSQIAASSTSNEEPKTSKTKAQLWNELKITAITRCFTLIYALSVLSLLTRIQLNLLGRKNYLSSVVSLASRPLQDSTISLENRDDDNLEQTYGNDFETNRKYLTFSWWLLHRGWKDLLENVEHAVQDVFGPRKPNEDVSFEKMSGLILDVRRKVEGATPEERKSRKWLSSLLPPREQEQDVLREASISTPPSGSQNAKSKTSPDIPSPPASPSSNNNNPPDLRRILDETADLIDSPMFSHVLTHLLDAAFSLLADTKLRSEAFKLPLQAAEPPLAARITDVTEAPPAAAPIRLATILAVMTREAHKIGNGVPNEYVQAVEGVSELEAFAAVVYSSNFEAEISPNTGFSHGASDRESAVKAERGATTSEDTSVVEAKEAITTQDKSGIFGKATGLVDATWTGFESAWARVIGSGSP